MSCPINSWHNDFNFLQFEMVSSHDPFPVQAVGTHGTRVHVYAYLCQCHEETAFCGADCGMPVAVNQNFDVAAGVVNGSYGFLRNIRYVIDDVDEALRD